MRLGLLSDQACHCLSFSTLPEDPFAVEQNSEGFEEPEKLVWFQKIFGLFGPSCAKVSVFKEVSLKDYLSSFFKSLSDPWDEAAL